jgi:RNA polymerase sigma factor (sigma-70 family)
VRAFRGEGSSGVAPSPERVLLAGEAQAEVREAIGRLRDEERLVVACRYLMDLSEAETAAALGIPAGTVKSRLHRALGRLREDLADIGPLAEASR